MAGNGHESSWIHRRKKKDKKEEVPEPVRPDQLKRTAVTVDANDFYIFPRCPLHILGPTAWWFWIILLKCGSAPAGRLSGQTLGDGSCAVHVHQSEKQLQNLIAKIKSDKLIFKRLRMLKLEIESGVTCSAGYAMACPASLTFVLDLIVPINIFVSRDLEMSPDGHWARRAWRAPGPICWRCKILRRITRSAGITNLWPSWNALAAALPAVVTWCCPWSRRMMLMMYPFTNSFLLGGWHWLDPFDVFLLRAFLVWTVRAESQVFEDRIHHSAYWCPLVPSGVQCSRPPTPLGETSQWTCREARLSTVLAPFWVEEIAVPVIKAEAGLGPETEIDFQVWFLKKCLRDLASWMDLNKDCEPEWWSPDYARRLTREEDEEEWYRNQQKGSMVCLLAMMWMVVISLTFQSSSYKPVSS